MTRMRTMFLLTTALLFTACKKDDAPDSGPVAPPAMQERVLDEEGLIMVEVDLNGDGKPDIFNVFQERDDAPRLRLLKKVDLDFDGRVDIVSHFDERGALYLEEMDPDFDGVFDWTDHYKDGIRVLSERDSNFDGRADIFSYYTVGTDGKPRVDRKERDTTGDGRIDTWERFDASGNVIRTGRDTDGDGKMDVRDE